MNYEKLKEIWKTEENYAFQGWDFSHLTGRWDNEHLPWDYQSLVKDYLKPNHQLLDIGTGGGEFLLSLNHPCSQTSVTEGYPPNVELCRKVLSPLGITVAQTFSDDKLPFESEHFDIIINRHASFNLAEVSRVLKKGGYFITQQVGEKNNNDLSTKLIPDFTPAYKGHNLKKYTKLAPEQHLQIINAAECFSSIKFFDVGALVYFAKIIEWEFPGFHVDSCFERLCKCQDEIEKHGYVEGTEHRFLLIAKKNS